MVNKIRVILIVLVVVLLVPFIRTARTYQYERKAVLTSPFEATNSNSRFALTQAIVEDHTFYLDEEEAAFSAPDITYYEGKYFSIFTPGISFMAVPFYYIGNQVGWPQFGAYFINLIFLIGNVLLIAKIAENWSQNKLANLLAGVIFAFATNSLAYSQTLTQHLASTTVILLGLMNTLENKRNATKNIILGLLIGVGVLIDIPNMFSFLPIIIKVAMDEFQTIKILKFNKSEAIKVATSMFGYLIGIIPMVVIFCLYNFALTGSYFKLAQLLGRSDYPHKEYTEVVIEDRKLTGYEDSDTPLTTRDEMRNFYLLLISDQRGVLYYSPIVVFGIIGMIIAYKKDSSRVILFVSTAIFTIIVYSLHGDPWGGWAFGSRYMIPVAAIILVFLPVSLNVFKSNVIFVAIFLSTLMFSIWISTAGVLTTNSIPPKVEAVNLITPIPYTYEYNFNLIERNETGSYLYNSFLNNKMSLKTYHIILVEILMVVLSTVYITAYINERKERKS